MKAYEKPEQPGKGNLKFREYSKENKRKIIHVAENISLANLMQKLDSSDYRIILIK